MSDGGLGFAASRVLGSVCFSLGLLRVVVAGAEFFAGKDVPAMSWTDGKVSALEVLRNCLIVCFANFMGACGLAALVF